jgi:hypothetical protein
MVEEDRDVPSAVAAVLVKRMSTTESTTISAVAKGMPERRDRGTADGLRGEERRWCTRVVGAE